MAGVVNEKNESSTKNQVGGTPTVLIIDTSGKIAEIYRGLPEDTRDKLTKSLSQLTSAKTP